MENQLDFSRTSWLVYSWEEDVDVLHFEREYGSVFHCKNQAAGLLRMKLFVGALKVCFTAINVDRAERSTKRTILFDWRDYILEISHMWFTYDA